MCSPTLARKDLTRVDSNGRAYAGSQHCIQYYVNYRRDDLTKAIIESQDSLGSTTLGWVSPLEADGFTEYRDEVSWDASVSIIWRPPCSPTGPGTALLGCACCCTPPRTSILRERLGVPAWLQSHMRDEMKLDWKTISNTEEKGGRFVGWTRKTDSFRTKVPGGWFIYIQAGTGGSGFFYPDPEHTWDGNSLP